MTAQTTVLFVHNLLQHPEFLAKIKHHAGRVARGSMFVVDFAYKTYQPAKVARYILLALRHLFVGYINAESQELVMLPRLAIAFASKLSYEAQARLLFSRDVRVVLVGSYKVGRQLGLRGVLPRVSRVIGCFSWCCRMVPNKAAVLTLTETRTLLHISSLL